MKTHEQRDEKKKKNHRVCFPHSAVPYRLALSDKRKITFGKFISKTCRGLAENILNFVLKMWAGRVTGIIQNVFMCSVDLEKAFDRVSCGVLWRALCEYGIWGASLRAVRSPYHGVLFTSEGGLECEIDRRIEATSAGLRLLCHSVVVKRELSQISTS